MNLYSFRGRVNRLARGERCISRAVASREIRVFVPSALEVGHAVSRKEISGRRAMAAVRILSRLSPVDENFRAFTASCAIRQLAVRTSARIRAGRTQMDGIAGRLKRISHHDKDHPSSGRRFSDDGCRNPGIRAGRGDSETGAFAFYHPNADVLNAGRGGLRSRRCERLLQWWRGRTRDAAPQRRDRFATSSQAIGRDDPRYPTCAANAFSARSTRSGASCATLWPDAVEGPLARGRKQRYRA